MASFFTSDQITVFARQPRIILAPPLGRHRRRRFVRYPGGLYLAPIAVVTTPGQLAVRAYYLGDAVRTKREAQQRAPHYRLHAPKVIFVRRSP